MALDDDFEFATEPVPDDFEFATEAVVPPVDHQKIYRDRLEHVRIAGKKIQDLRDRASTLPTGNQERTDLEGEADGLMSALDSERKEFYERRHDDIFLEDTPITRTPLAGLGFGAREFVEGQLSLGATGASMFYRTIGADDRADAVNKGMQALRQYNDIAAKRELGRPGQVFSHVLKGLTEMGPIGSAGSAAQMAPKEIGKMLAGYSAINTVNQSLTEGADRGLKGKDLAGYALSNGAADYILGQAANELSLALGGGLGEVVSPLITKQATKLSFGRAARDFLVTSTLEALPNGAQSLVNDGLRLTYGVDPNLKAKDVLDNALLQATVGAVGGATTTTGRYAKVATDNFNSVIKGWGDRLRANGYLKEKVATNPKSVEVIRVDKGPRTTDVKSAAYGPAYQIKKLAVQELRNLPPEAARRIMVNAHLRDAEATLSNVRATPEGRKAATDYLERELADVDDRINKNEIDFGALGELENELIQRPIVPPELVSKRDALKKNIATMEDETKSLVQIAARKPGIMGPSPEAKNAKLRLGQLEPAVDENKAALADVEEQIRIYEGEIADVNATTRTELDGELSRLLAERVRALQEKEIISDELKRVGEVESESLKTVKDVEPANEASKIVEESGDYQLEALRQRSVNELREDFGYDKLSTDDKITMDQARLDAIQKGIPEKALEISNNFLATRKPMDMTEVVGVGMRTKDLGIRYAELDKLEKSGTLPQDSLDAIDAEMQQVEGEIRTLTEALYHTGTDTARALAARTRQNWVKLWGPRFKSRLQKKAGGELSPETSKLVDDLVSKIGRFDDELLRLDPRSDEFVDKAYERELLVRDLEWIRAKIEWNSLTKGQKGVRVAAEGLNLWRAWLTSGDGVPVLRQGAAMWGHPLITMRSVPIWYKAFANDKSAFKFDVESRYGRKNSDLYGKRFFSDLADPLEARDEMAASTVANMLPGLRNFSHAYRAWVNRMRADSFDAMVEANGGRENLTKEQIDSIRNVVLDSTGRGGLPGFERSSKALFSAFIAPRWFTSRFSTALALPVVKAAARGDAKAAYIGAKEYGKMIAGLGTITYIIEQLGQLYFGEENVKFTRDVTDPNFGRLRVGQQYIDITGSLAMPVRMLSAIFENLNSTFTGSKRERDAERVVGGSITSRLAPGLSLTHALVTNKVFGEDVTPGIVAQNYAVPWPLGTVVETLEKDGYDQAVIATFLEHFGGGAFYKPPTKKKFKL